MLFLSKNLSLSSIFGTDTTHIRMLSLKFYFRANLHTIKRQPSLGQQASRCLLKLANTCKGSVRQCRTPYRLRAVYSFMPLFKGSAQGQCRTSCQPRAVWSFMPPKGSFILHAAHEQFRPSRRPRSTHGRKGEQEQRTSKKWQQSRKLPIVFAGTQLLIQNVTFSSVQIFFYRNEPILRE